MRSRAADYNKAGPRIYFDHTINARYGVAMTAAVIRHGRIKSHMLFHAGMLLSLEDETNELYGQAHARA